MEERRGQGRGGEESREEDRGGEGRRAEESRRSSGESRGEGSRGEERREEGRGENTLCLLPCPSSPLPFMRLLREVTLAYSHSL